MAFLREQNYEAIVLWKRKGRLDTTIELLTREKGIISAYIPHNRLKSLKNPAFFQPFSHIDITLREESDNYYIVQIIGKTINEKLSENLTNIAYTALSGELISKIFNKGEVNAQLFTLVKFYTRALLTKNIPIASILLGWQLLSLGGFLPSGKNYLEKDVKEIFLQELYRSTGISLARCSEELLGEILRYDWQEDSVLNLQKGAILELNAALFAYSEVQIGEPLESLKFLKLVSANLFE